MVKYFMGCLVVVFLLTRRVTALSYRVQHIKLYMDVCVSGVFLFSVKGIFLPQDPAQWSGGETAPQLSKLGGIMFLLTNFLYKNMLSLLALRQKH